jgi:hypothetical protein
VRTWPPHGHGDVHAARRQRAEAEAFTTTTTKTIVVVVVCMRWIAIQSHLPLHSVARHSEPGFVTDAFVVRRNSTNRVSTRTMSRQTIRMIGRLRCKSERTIPAFVFVGFRSVCVIERPTNKTNKRHALVAKSRRTACLKSETNESSNESTTDKVQPEGEIDKVNRDSRVCLT